MSEESISEDYAPQGLGSGEQEEPLRRYRKRIQKSVQNSVEGKWTEEQNLKYALFMDFHTKTFVSKEKRKSSRIFKTLSNFLGSRTPRQCRSHFQKIIGKFKTVKKVKQYYQETLGIVEYQNRLNKITMELEPQIVKLEEKEVPHINSSTSVEVQTDPLRVTISDLPESELTKLISTLGSLNRLPPPLWIPPPFPYPHDHHFGP